MLNKSFVRLCDFTRRLLQAEPRAIANKPGVLARKMDRYGFRIISFGLIFLLLQQFGLTLGAAFFGALILLVALHLALKSDKPKYVFRRVRRVPQAALELNNPEEETAADRAADKTGSPSRRYLSPVFTGLVLMGFGWLWSGGWGIYFISLGLINFALAGLVFWGQRRIKTELAQDMEN